MGAVATKTKTLDFRVLGPLEVIGEKGPLALGGQKQRALLGLLLIRAGEVVSSDRLMHELWGEHPPRTAKTSLHNHVVKLRQLLGPALLETHPPGYVLHVDPESTDLGCFERLLAEAKREEPARRVELLLEALALWRGGHPLADLAFESFAQGEIRRLEELRLEALEERLEAELALGEGASLVPELEALVGSHPLRERLRGALMLALYRDGRQADALAAYEDARRTLSEELGVDPGPALRELHAAIVRQEVDLLPVAAVAPPSSLPRPISSFVGRERELAEVVSLLEGGARLLTLVGPGGSGKTRLAIEAARSLVPAYRDGVCWVGLAPLRDPLLVTSAIAQALGARDDLARFVGGREMLLLLDNFEQVADAAPELVRLLESCPNLTLLVTSRELLRVRGEVEYEVKPLSEAEAVELFHERSRAGVDEAVAALCRRLDNLPLAVELAAARTSALAPAQILAHLSEGLDLLKGGRDAEARQRTLRATVEWSYELLSHGERQLFARLAVFAGGCTLEAAEAICEADLDTLQSLVDKSLLRFTGERYLMLETIREYAAELLEEGGEADERRLRHAEFFTGIAERAEPEMDRADVVRALALDEGNFRSALWLLSGDREPELMLRLATSLFRFWDQRGQLPEAQSWLKRAEELGGQVPLRLRAKARAGLAWTYAQQWELTRAEALMDEALELHRQLGDQTGVGWCLNALGGIAMDQGRLDDAESLLQESIRFLDQAHSLAPLTNLAEVAARRGDLTTALQLHQEVLAAAREVGNDRFVRSALADLAWIAVLENRLEDVAPLARASLAMNERVSDVPGIALCVLLAGVLVSSRGSHRSGALLVGAGASKYEETGGRIIPPGDTRPFAELERIIGEQRLAALFDEGAALPFDDAVELAKQVLVPRSES